MGNEGIHVRDGSNNCIIKDCNVYDLRLYLPQFAEGIYVKEQIVVDITNTENIYNTKIINSKVGPDVKAEHFDIKEGTFNTIVEGNEIDAKGMVETAFEDSFVDIKGERVILRRNVMNRKW